MQKSRFRNTAPFSRGRPQTNVRVRRLELELRAHVGDLVLDELADRLPQGVLLVFFQLRVYEISDRADDGAEQTGQQRPLQVAVARIAIFRRVIVVTRIGVAHRFHACSSCGWLRGLWRLARTVTYPGYPRAIASKPVTSERSSACPSLVARPPVCKQ